MSRVIACIAAILVVGACTADQPATSQCRRPAAKTFADGSTLTITGSASFPCQIAYDSTGVELRADVAGEVANIGQQVARDSRGRYYTATEFGEVTVWGPDGKVLRSIGHQGEGPGEFASGFMAIELDSQDNLYVRDRVHWSIFSADYTFLRSLSSSGTGYSPEATMIIAPFTMLTSDFIDRQSRRGQRRYFTILDLSGKSSATENPSAGSSTRVAPAVVRTFGDELPPSNSAWHVVQMMSEPVAGEFWAGPPPNAGRGYELQLWTLDGAVKRTIRREVTWFKPGSDIAKTSPNPSEHENAPPPPNHPPPTSFAAVRHDGKGLIYAMILVVNDKWDSSPSTANDDRKFAAMFRDAAEVYAEVIDVDAGVVLASEGPIGMDRVEAEMMRGWFSGWSGYRRTEDSDGLPVIKMMEVRLVGRE